MSGISASLRNLEFPLDWQGIIDYVGFPSSSNLRRRGWKNVSGLIRSRNCGRNTIRQARFA